MQSNVKVGTGLGHKTKQPSHTASSATLKVWESRCRQYHKAKEKG